MVPPPIDSALVADPATLDEVMRGLAGATLVAIDTEFVRERTYYPELCVVQIASADTVVAIDCLARLDLDPVFDWLFADSRPWLLHSARQDLEVLFNRAERLPAKLVDTQVAAALLGHPLQIGLKGLLEAELDISLGKEHTRADWSARPLAPAVVGYALDDVRYLEAAWERLSAKLDARGRTAWFEEDCERQLHLPLEPEPATILDRTKGAAGLRGRERAAALALVAWREERAKQRDKPRRWILADDQLVAIATSRPPNPAALGRLAGLPPKLVERSGQSMLTAIDQAETVAELPAAKMPDKARVKALQAEVRARAAQLGVQPELLATRRDIAAVAAGQAVDAFRSGWRGNILRDLAE
jgi:ribonuclease D